MAFVEEIDINNIINQEYSNILPRIPFIKVPMKLHILPMNYNWDDGFELPWSIINNPNCELATALMIFYNVDGYSHLDDLNKTESFEISREYKFWDLLYKRIESDGFKRGYNEYIPSLSKVQI